jgi:tetratricopeptide (TPR) repeat protein
MSKEVAHTLQHLGEAHRAARRHDDAKQAHSRSLEIFETFGPEMAVEESDALHCLALVFHDEGEFEEAERYYNLALNRILEAAVNDRSIEAKIRRNLGSLKLDEQCFEEAERYLLGALDVKRGANDGATVDPIALILLARTAAGQCEPDDAIHYYRRAIEALEVTTGLVHRDLIEPLQELSGVLADVGRHDEAAILRGQAEAILGDEGTSPVLH